MKKLLIGLLLFFSVISKATVYYVSTTGSDSNSGLSVANAWATWQYGFTHIAGGDILYIKGGTYSPTADNVGNAFGVRVNYVDGTSGSRITVANYPGEIPILDGSTLTSITGQNVGVGLYGCDYWDFIGLTVINVIQHSDNGFSAPSWYMEGCTNSTWTRCTVYNCGRGFCWVSGCDEITATNCDSYNNRDRFNTDYPIDIGGLCDGFYLTVDAGHHFYFVGCRAWHNTDDGWDTFNSNGGYVSWINCWAFLNGYYLGTDGNGSGIKWGVINGAIETGIQRTMKSCVSAWNNVNYDQNSGPSGTIVRCVLYNCTSASAIGQGIQMYYDNLGIIRNCISYAESLPAGDLGGGTIDHNSWQDGHTVTSGDFASVDTTLLKSARLLNGNLPLITTYHLVTGSDLKNAGLAISGLVYDCDGVAYASPPSMGAFEFVVPSGNTVLTVENQTLTSTYTAAHVTTTDFTFWKNSLTTSNTTGYLLNAGDEVPGVDNNKLNAAIITGNKFSWTGTQDGTILTHGIFTGYNINDIIRSNYLLNVPYGIVIKSGQTGTNQIYTAGGVAYNIIKNSFVGVRIKGMNNVPVYNNTFYNSSNINDSFINITMNDDGGTGTASTGTKIKNNIFYSTVNFYNIYVETGSDPTPADVDYNVYYCEAGTPLFNYHGVSKTFAQWQAYGFDVHSTVVNPNFINTTAFVPTARLDYGTDLGTTWLSGVSPDATWTVGTAPEAANQNGTWQTGAIIYPSPSDIPVTSITVSGTGGATTISTDDGTLQMLATVLPSNATNPAVAWSVVSGTYGTVDVSGLLTATANGSITVRATAQDGSGIYDDQVIVISNQVVPSHVLKSGTHAITSGGHAIKIQ